MFMYTSVFMTYIFFLFLGSTLLSFCTGLGGLPLARGLMGSFLGLEELCDQVWTVQVIIWLPCVVITEEI